MGFRVSLYAIFDCDVERIHADLELDPTGERQEFPDSAVVGAVAPSGAYILYVNDRSCFGEDLIRPISRTARVIACNVNETVMYSAAACIRNRREEWSVVHDASKGLLHLEATGDLPRCYPTIRDAKFAAQAAEDDVDHVFDVPVGLFVELGGVRYDQDLETGQKEPWMVLKQRKKRRWLWSRFRD